jgi:site-specific recombinase XerD
MSEHKSIIARFMEVSAVRAAGRAELCDGTKRDYVRHLKKFYRFTGRKPASAWTPQDVERYMVSLRAEGYSRSSRKALLCAVVYVFKHVLCRDMGVLNLPAMPKEQRTIKIIPTREEVGRIFAGMKGMVRVMAGLMYGAGLRVKECCTLRVKDVDFAAMTVRVYDSKHDKSRLCLLPEAMVPVLKRMVAWRAALHDCDLAQGAGIVGMPGRLAIKYKSAPRSLAWQFLFASSVLRGQKRWHISTKAVQKAMKIAVAAAGILKQVTPHTLRHAYCTHSLRVGNDPATVQDLMGHDSLETTMIYAHGDAARGVSPMDAADLIPRRHREPFLVA